MAAPKIEIPYDSLVQKGERTTGVVYWNVDGACFPSDEWTDAVVIVVTWWAEALSRMIRGSTGRETLDFMDGPYRVRCQFAGSIVHCHFTERHDFDLVLAQWDGPPRELKRAVFQAGDKLMRCCKADDLKSAEIDRLERAVRKLRSLL